MAVAGIYPGATARRAPTGESLGRGLPMTLDGSDMGEMSALTRMGQDFSVREHGSDMTTRAQYSHIKCIGWETAGWNDAYVIGAPLVTIPEISKALGESDHFAAGRSRVTKGTIALAPMHFNSIAADAAAALKAKIAEEQQRIGADVDIVEPTGKRQEQGGSVLGDEPKYGPTSKFSFVTSLPEEVWAEIPDGIESHEARIYKRYFLAGGSEKRSDLIKAISDAYSEFPRLRLCNAQYIARNMNFVGFVEAVNESIGTRTLDITVGVLRTSNTSNYWGPRICVGDRVGFCVTTAEAAGTDAMLTTGPDKNGLVMVPWTNASAAVPPTVIHKNALVGLSDSIRYTWYRDRSGAVQRSASFPVGTISGLPVIAGMFGPPVDDKKAARRTLAICGILEGDRRTTNTFERAMKALVSEPANIRVSIGWRG